MCDKKPLIFKIFMKMCFSHSIINFHFREKHLPTLFYPKFFFHVLPTIYGNEFPQNFQKHVFFGWKICLFDELFNCFTGTIIVEFWKKKLRWKTAKSAIFNRTLICSAGSLKSNAYNEKSTVKEWSGTSK